MSTIPEGQQDRPSPRNVGTGAYPREMAQFALPMKPTNAKTWSRSNGDVTYTVSAGTLFEANNEPYMELPSGKYARAAIFYLFSHARWTKEGTLSLGVNPRQYLELAGVSSSGSGYAEAVRQLQLVARAQFTVKQTEVVEDTAIGPYEEAEIGGGILAEKVRLWTPLADKSPEQLTSAVVISRYFEQMVERAVPVPRTAWRYLMTKSKSPMPLDIYVWLCHRLFQMSDVSRISWTQLYEQFGSVSDMRDFKRQFRKALELVQEVYPEAKIKEEQGATQRKGFSGYVLRPGTPKAIESSFHDSV